MAGVSSFQRAGVISPSSDDCEDVVGFRDELAAEKGIFCRRKTVVFCFPPPGTSFAGTLENLWRRAESRRAASWGGFYTGKHGSVGFGALMKAISRRPPLKFLVRFKLIFIGAPSARTYQDRRGVRRFPFRV